MAKKSKSKEDKALATVQEELAELRGQIAELEGKLKETEDRRLRILAEFDNFRKRSARDNLDGRSAAKADTLMAVLNVFDHFSLAMAAAENSDDLQVLRDGMKMIMAEFEKTMQELGVTAIDAVGNEFDPNLHEAVAREPSADVPENHIIKQWRCGYRLGEKLLRPATVVVSSGTQEIAEDETDETDN